MEYHYPYHLPPHLPPYPHSQYHYSGWKSGLAQQRAEARMTSVWREILNFTYKSIPFFFKNLRGYIFFRGYPRLIANIIIYYVFIQTHVVNDIWPKKTPRARAGFEPTRAEPNGLAAVLADIHGYLITCPRLVLNKYERLLFWNDWYWSKIFKKLKNIGRSPEGLNPRLPYYKINALPIELTQTTNFQRWLARVSMSFDGGSWL